MTANGKAPEKELSFDSQHVLEKAHIRAGRSKRLGCNEEKVPWCGIGLSGGGIRSACIALGVLQSLADKRLLSRFDYISTVSGGGYTGASLQWWWSRTRREDGIPNPTPPFGLNPEDFPYGPGRKPAKSDPDRTKPDDASVKKAVKPQAEEAAARAICNLDFLRTHSSYLTPGNGLSIWSMLVVLVRTVVISLLIWMPLLTACFALLHVLDCPLEKFAAWIELRSPLGSFIPGLWDADAQSLCADPNPILCIFRLRAIYAFLIYGFYLAALVFGCFAVLYGLLSRSPQETVSGSKLQLSAGVVALALVAVVLWLARGYVVLDISFVVWIFVAIVICSVVVVRIVTERFTEHSLNASYWLRRGLEKWLGRFFLPSVVIFAIGLLPLLPYQAGKIEVLSQGAAGGGLASVFSLVSGVLAALYGYYTFIRNIVPGLAGKIVATIGSVIYLYGTLVLAYWLSVAIVYSPGVLGDSKFVIETSACLFLVALALGLFANINYVGLHRFYRDRLMEAFMPNDRSVGSMKGNYSSVADSLSVAALAASSCEDPADADYIPKPYPLINANGIMLNDEDPKAASRGGVNFLISPLYVGSSVTGWQDTSKYIELNGPLTLSTSMAASGAAASASAGSLGAGITMNPLVSAVMSLLNIRLGVWVGNPAMQADRKIKSIPTFLNPGLKAGIFGRGHRRDSDFIELTDGGHFENLALYELVRRKVALILVVDGEADPTISLSSLVSAKNRIEQDFGATLTFYEGQGPELLVMHPDRGYPLGVKYARSPFIVGELAYCNGAAGTFIYIKSNITPELDFSTSGYLASNPDFPHQTTVDQFFSSDQFEAYRNLGIESALNMIKTLELESNIGVPADVLKAYKASGPRIQKATNSHAPGPPLS